MVEIFFWEDLESNNVNPYEAVIGTAREARWINQSRRAKSMETDDKPTTLALRRVVSGKAKVAYLTPNEISDVEEAYANQSISDEEEDSSGGDGGNIGL